LFAIPQLIIVSPETTLCLYFYNFNVLLDALKSEELMTIDGEKLPTIVQEKEAIPPLQKKQQLSENATSLQEADYLNRFQAITAEAVAVAVNPNCFLQFDCDVDPAVALADEAVARRMASFLWDVVMPGLTFQIREGELLPKDNDAMVKLVHTMVSFYHYIKSIWA